MRDYAAFSALGIFGFGALAVIELHAAHNSLFSYLALVVQFLLVRLAAANYAAFRYDCYGREASASTTRQTSLGSHIANLNARDHQNTGAF